jgi:2,4-dienoyl-CoA reductase-like NADH-dependent reductase (Old Yellow Enzyme family)
MTLPKLLTPTTLGPHHLKNRMVMSPLTRNRAHNETKARGRTAEGRRQTGVTVTGWFLNWFP